MIIFLGDKMNEQTWITLLKVLTGITDYFIFARFENNKLLSLLLNITFKVYVQSGIKQTEIVESFFFKWTKEEIPLVHWYKLTSAYTSKVLELVCDNVKEENKSDYYKLLPNMSDEYLIYMWFKMLMVFGRGSINSKLQKIQIERLMRVVDYIYNTISNNIKTAAVFSINIIKPKFMMSNILKEAVANFITHKKKSCRLINLYFFTEYFTASVFDENIPYLIEFLNKYNGPYKHIKLALYYDKIIEWYNNLYTIPDISLIKEVIDINLPICSGRQYGVNILIAPFLKLVGHLINEKEILIDQIENLIMILLKVSSLVSAYQNSYRGSLPSTTFIDNWTKSSIYLQQIANSFSLGRFKEKFYWLVSISVMQNYGSTEKMEYLVKFIGKGFNFLNEKNVLEGNIREIFSILDIAETIVYSFIYCRQTIPDTSSITSYLLDIITKSLDEKLLIKKYKPLEYENIICKILKLCMLLGNTSHITIIKEIALKLSRPPSNQLKENYITMEKYALAVLDSFRFNNKRLIAKDLSNNSTVFSNTKDVLEHTVNYTMKERVITVKEMKSINANNLLITVRDATGVFSYIGQTICNINNPINYLHTNDNAVPNDVFNDERNDLLVSSKSVFKDIPSPEIMGSVELQVKTEEEFLKTKNRHEKKFTRKKREEQPVSNRVFLHHFKILNSNSISLLENNETLKILINELDLISLKKTIPILLLYTEEHNKRYSEDLIFLDFINVLGIQLSNDYSKTGYFNHIRTHIENIVYTSNYFNEFLFLCPFISSTKSKNEILWSEVKMIVVWNKNTTVDEKNIVSSIKNIGYNDTNMIIITPIKNGLVLVNMLKIVNNINSYCKLLIKFSE